MIYRDKSKYEFFIFPSYNTSFTSVYMLRIVYIYIFTTTTKQQKINWINEYKKGKNVVVDITRSAYYTH